MRAVLMGTLEELLALLRGPTRIKLQIPCQ